jgi:hypothetical protein
MCSAAALLGVAVAALATAHVPWHRSRICASARFSRSQTRRKPSWHSDYCNATVDFKVDFKKQRAAVSDPTRHTPRAEEGERLQIIQAG